MTSTADRRRRARAQGTPDPRATARPDLLRPRARRALRRTRHQGRHARLLRLARRGARPGARRGGDRDLLQLRAGQRPQSDPVGLGRDDAGGGPRGEVRRNLRRLPPDPRRGGARRRRRWPRRPRSPARRPPCSRTRADRCTPRMPRSTGRSRPHLQLFHAQTLLREHRGDGHIAALVVAGLDAVEALVTHVQTGEGLPEDMLRATRGWPDEAWDAATVRVQDRGLLDADGALTTAGTELREHDRGADRRGRMPRRTFISERSAPNGCATWPDRGRGRSASRCSGRRHEREPDFSRQGRVGHRRRAGLRRRRRAPAGLTRRTAWSCPTSTARPARRSPPRSAAFSLRCDVSSLESARPRSRMTIWSLRQARPRVPQRRHRHRLQG